MKVRRQGFAGRFYFPPEMNLGVAVVGHLAKCVFHISISIEHGTLITRDQLLLCCLREVVLPQQLAAVEDCLQEIRTKVPGKIGTMKKRVDGRAGETTITCQRELRQECKRSVCGVLD